MIIFKTVADIASFINLQKSNQSTIGFVPTMGALHKGHISLIEKAKIENNLNIASIFVNPTQFNNISDFEKYPITIETDIDKLEAAGCDVLFLPSVTEMYPLGTVAPQYNLGYLETVLEGEFRPGHYQGVCQVVERLLRIVQPDKLYLGQKDYQQCMVISKLLELQKIDIILQIENTIREKDGLAMSSRNARLNEQERQQAVKIFESLSLVKKDLQPGDLQPIKQKAFDFLTRHKFKVDYVEFADANNLQIVNHWNGKTPLVVLIAAYLNDVRLIDNFVLAS